MKNKFIFLCLIFLVFSSLMYYFFGIYNFANTDSNNQESKINNNENEPISNKYNFFAVKNAVNSTKTESINIFGKARATTSYSVIPPAQGLITKLFVINGNMVKKGQLIAYLDNKLLKEEEAQLNSEYKLADTEVDRIKRKYEADKKLYDLGIIPRQDYENSYFNYEQAKIAKEIAKSKAYALNTQLSYRKITAENSGYIINLMPEGTLVGPGLSPIANIEAKASELELNIPFSLKVYPGDKLFIEEKEYKINSIYTDSLDNRTAIVKVETGFENSQPVNAIFKKTLKGIEVPQQSVVTYDGNPVVFTISEKNGGCLVKAVPIKIIYSDEKNYLISGIENNTRIIAKGAEILTNEEKIECEK